MIRHQRLCNKVVKTRTHCKSLLDSWVKSITNHVYWSAASSSSDDGEMILAKWISLANHIQNIHENHGTLFPKCLHDDLSGRDWLKPGTKASTEVEDVILNKRLCGDIKKMSTTYQTSSLEAFHSVINQFAPKLYGFSFYGQLCRQYLAALHFNKNHQRKAKVSKDGRQQVTIIFPRYKSGDEYSVRQEKEAMTFEYVTELMTATEQLCCLSNNSMATPAPPYLTSSKRKPCKMEALSELKTRFKKIKRALEKVLEKQ